MPVRIASFVSQHLTGSHRTAIPCHVEHPLLFQMAIILRLHRHRANRLSCSRIDVWSPVIPDVGERHHNDMFRGQIHRIDIGNKSLRTKNRSNLAPDSWRG